MKKESQLRLVLDNFIIGVFMSRQQFGLGYHLGQEEAYESIREWETHCHVGKINYLLCSLTRFLQEKTEKALHEELDNDSEINVLCDTILLLNSLKMQKIYSEKEREKVIKGD